MRGHQGTVRRYLSTTATTTAASINPSSSNAPADPLGQRTAAPGIRANVRATKTSQAHGTPPARAITWATGIDSGATAAVMTPRTVAGATAGSASRFAGIDARLICPEIDAMSGAQASVAAVGTASASASQPGTRRAMRARNRGANTSSDAVAATDNANPTLRDSVGSMKIRHSTAAHNAGKARRRRPVARASTATRPIAAARKTLAWGRATMTNPTIVSTPISAWARRPTPTHRATTSAAPKTIATFAPENVA